MDFIKNRRIQLKRIFLGASITINGITPTELYRDYGICAYNLGTEQQPVMASYYWMLEAERCMQIL